MEKNYLVSARKYRPSTFEAVLGQQHITNTLQNAIKTNQLAQAFLFCGPRGVGKTTCARILAKTINCPDKTASIEACNKCSSCTSFNNATSYNIHELDAASNNSVEDIRRLVEQVRYPPQSGKYKIYIVDEVHMLSASAFNAFLKTLEEPPPYAIFILATTEKHKIIPTILSRCQLFDFNRIQQTDIIKQLSFIAQKENVEAETDALHVIAEKADGALRDALSVYDQLVSFSNGKISYKSVIENLHILDYDYYFNVTQSLLEYNTNTALLILDEVLNKGFDEHNFINGLSSHFRNLLMVKDTATLKLLEVSQGIKEKYHSQSLKADTAFLMNALKITNQCDINYKASKNKRLHVELALIQISNINAIVASGSHISQDQPVKKKAPAELINTLSGINQTTSPETKPPVPVAISAIAQAKRVSADVIELKPVQSSESNGNKSLKENNNEYADVSVKIEILNEIQAQFSNPERQIIPVSVSQVNNTAPSEINLVRLNDEWNNYADTLKDNGKMSLYSLMKNHTPQLKDNVLIEVTVDNKVQVEQLISEKNNILDFLKNKLKNDNLNINPLLSAKNDNKLTPYTAHDKFKRMSEKNPCIIEMKERLGLDIDY